MDSPFGPGETLWYSGTCDDCDGNLITNGTIKWCEDCHDQFKPEE